MRRLSARFAALACAGLLLSLVPSAAAETAYDDGETSTATAADITSPDGHAIAEAHADPVTNELWASASASSDSLLPIPHRASVSSVGDFNGIGFGVSTTSASAYLTRTIEVSPGTHHLSVTFSGLVADASADGEGASSFVDAWLHTVGDPGSATAGLYRGGELLRVVTVSVSVGEYAVASHALACTAPQQDCSIPDTLVLEVTISARKAIWLAVGVSSSARATRGVAAASVAAKASAVTVTQIAS